MFQALKSNPNPLQGISLYFLEGKIYEFHYVPFANYALQSSDSEQLDLPLAPHETLQKVPQPSSI